MGWGAAIGSIGGALIASQAAGDQADAMRGATQEQIDFMREKFGYARDLQEQLLQEQAPAREASSRATRSLSMMAGLGDPGSVERQREEARLRNLQEQLTEADKFLTTEGRIEPLYGRKTSGVGPDRYRGHGDNLFTEEEISQAGGSLGRYEKVKDRFVEEETRLNPEFQRLEEEIATLEQELGGEMPGDQFEGPMDVTEMPGYQFALDQGQEALASSGAARGMQLSGNQMQDITKFGQGTAMQFRGQLIDQLAQVAGLRPSNAAYTNMGNLAQSQAATTSPLLGQMGQISAAETAGQAGALGNAFANMPWGQMGGSSSPIQSQGGMGSVGRLAMQYGASGSGRTF